MTHAAHLTNHALLQAEEEATDVDHFNLNEEGDCLQVNPRWLRYLQVTYLTVCHIVAGKSTSR